MNKNRTFYLPDELVQEYEKLARAENNSTNSVVRRALSEFLKRGERRMVNSSAEFLERVDRR